MNRMERLRRRKRERYRLSRSTETNKACFTDTWTDTWADAVSSVQLQNVLTQARPTMLKHLSSIMSVIYRDGEGGLWWVGGLSLLVDKAAKLFVQFLAPHVALWGLAPCGFCCGPS